MNFTVRNTLMPVLACLVFLLIGYMFGRATIPNVPPSDFAIAAEATQTCIIQHRHRLDRPRVDELAQITTVCRENFKPPQ